VKVDPRYFRPTEVETCSATRQGPRKAGLDAEDQLHELVKEMVVADYTRPSATPWSSWPASRPSTTTNEGQSMT
jgi:GDP-D-mannose dehydratase